jgi:hypothetical protein
VLARLRLLATSRSLDATSAVGCVCVCVVPARVSVCVCGPNRVGSQGLYEKTGLAHAEVSRRLEQQVEKQAGVGGEGVVGC